MQHLPYWLETVVLVLRRGMAVVGEWDEYSAGFGVKGIYVGGELCGEDGGSM
jgi:hypothetical protein